MTDLNDNKSIYDFGFDATLNLPTTSATSPLISNSLDQQVQSSNIIQGGSFNMSSLTLNGFEKTIGIGDDIQAGLNAVNNAGGGRLLLSAGTYTIRSNLTGYSSVSIEGVSSASTILNFQGNTNLTFAPTDAYTTGTISSIAFGVVVTGSGTGWSSSMIGKQIFINNRWYVIANVSDGTHLTLATGYADGATYSGSYRIASVMKNINLSGLTLQNSTGTALSCTDIRDLSLEDVLFLSNNVGFSLTNFMNITVNQTTCAASTSDGYRLTNGSFFNAVAGIAGVSNGGNGCTLNNMKTSGWILSACDSNTGDGFNLTSVANCTFQIEAAGNGGKGVQEVSGCSGNSYAGGSIINANTSDGIKLTATSNNDNIGADIQITNNGGWGINIANANCNNNTIIVPYFANNTSGNVNDLGTGTNQVLTASAPDVQTFASNGTWTKPSGKSVTQVILYSAGGGGGAGGGGAGNSCGGGGGGGGIRLERLFNISDLPSTASITVGVGGNGGVAGSSSSNGANGSAGGNSSFGTFLTAFGGGGGGGGINGNGSNNGGSGGGGGASGGVGTTGSVGGNATMGGLPATTAGASGVSGQGAGGAPGSNTNTIAGCGEEGGGGGAQGGGPTPQKGGSSIFGAGGGGGGGGSSNPGTDGGTTQSYNPGGGGAGGASVGTAGSNGANGNSTKSGSGGGGGAAGSNGGNSAGMSGGAGGTCGGGGGGGAAGTGTGFGGAGGKGGDGKVYVISW